MNVRVVLMIVCFLGTMSVVFGNQQMLGEDGAQKIREKLKEPLLRLLSSSEFAPIADVKKRWSDAKIAIDAFEKDIDLLMAQKVEQKIEPKAEVQQVPVAIPVVQPEGVSATKEEIQKELAGKEEEITKEIKAMQPMLQEEETQMAVPIQAPIVAPEAEQEAPPVIAAPVVPAMNVPAEPVPGEMVPGVNMPGEPGPAPAVPAEVIPAVAAPVAQPMPESMANVPVDVQIPAQEGTLAVPIEN